ncbi:MAG: His/Gly/Thr/Pro-type tRNA ligase C-terminal domain-containing protein, partial [Verrucomicrobiia bacterium]
KIGGKIRDAEINKVHTMLVLGKKEQESGSVALRIHGQGDQGVKPLEAALTDIQTAITERSL